MAIEQVFIDNEYRNFNYLVGCPDEKVAAVVDPLDVEMCLAAAERRGWRITHIINTHEHFDHVDGNPGVRRATGATICAYAGLEGIVPDVGMPLRTGQVVPIGATVTIEVLYTPGHTMGHVCLFVRDGEESILTGDTLFNAGVGNCRHGGDREALFATIDGLLAPLPDHWRIYPGHDYLERNLLFTLDREPGNEAAREVLDRHCGDAADAGFRSTLGLERRINCFLRLDSPEVVARLKDEFPDLPEAPGRRDVFLKLRDLRDAW